MNCHEMVVPSCAEQLDGIQLFVAREPCFAKLSAKSQYHVALCVEEAFANIVNYAYPQGSGQVRIAVTCDSVRNSIAIRFIDSGIPFNPLKEEPPDISAPSEHRTIGGLGIYIVRQLMDFVDYDFCEGQNILTIEKHLDTAPAETSCDAPCQSQPETCQSETETRLTPSSSCGQSHSGCDI